MKDRVLIVDDAAEIREMLRIFLQRDGYVVDAADSISALRERFAGDAPDVVLLDWKLPDGDGIETLPILKGHWPEAQVIVLTGVGTFEAAVEATKQGAFHFLGKPFQTEVLLSLVRRACEYKHLHDRAAAQQQALSFLAGGAATVFRSPAMKEVLRQAQHLAENDDCVLLTGEGGSGKTVVAKLIHSLGGRVGKPFYKMDCASMATAARGIFEWELFGTGTKAGATEGTKAGGLFNEAREGMVVLDEIQALRPELQELLVKVLRDRKFIPFGGDEARPLTCRVLATCQSDPQAAVLAGKLREDLLTLVSTSCVHVPSLRERREDILPMANAFLERFATQAQLSIKGFTPAAAANLEQYDWPGNVRQLENAIQSVVLTVSGGLVEVEHLPFNVRMEVAKRATEKPRSLLRLFKRD